MYDEEEEMSGHKYQSSESVETREVQQAIREALPEDLYSCRARAWSEHWTEGRGWGESDGEDPGEWVFAQGREALLEAAQEQVTYQWDCITDLGPDGEVTEEVEPDDADIRWHVGIEVRDWSGDVIECPEVETKVGYFARSLGAAMEDKD